MSALVLCVREGPSAGERVVAGEALITVGRASGNDLVLRDPSVSRRHLEARAEGGTLFVRAADGAAPFVARGESVREARLSPGETLLLGDTLLQIVTGEAAPSTTQRTDVRTLFDGASSEVRGLSALFQLTCALDAARDAASCEEALRAFVVEHVRGSEIGLNEAESAIESAAPNESAAGTSAANERTASTSAANERAAGTSAANESAQAPGNTASAAFLEHTSASATTLVLPTGLASPASITVRLPTADPLSNPLRRLLVVAARLLGSRIEQLRVLTSAREETASLRALAVGSARAFLGASKAAEHVARVVPRLAAADACALLLGESGVGKTFVARLIHESSPRAEAPLRVINCAAIPENLLEAELFGFERGAFTGAVAPREGAFESAGAGTLLLDEIGELGLTGQAKLLRALEEKRFERLGSNRSIALRARVLAATNRDLAAMVEEGTFRRDLFFRISVITLKIPALRERGDDIRLLAEQILSDLAPHCARRVRGFSAKALVAIGAYTWPGNVRELRNAIEHALVLGDGPLIEPSDLPEGVSAAASLPPPVEGASLVRLPMRLDELEDLAIQAALTATRGNRTRAAALLGINRVTLYKKLREEPPG